MPLIRRVPKRGFRNPFRVANQIVKLRDLDQVKGDEITPASLLGGGLVATGDRPVKILAGGDVTRAFVVRSCAVSKNAREKIEQAGGRIEA
jgi:large subunit ribosomal protein L15